MFSQKLKEKICKIKKLKLDNYLNNYFIHKTYYSDYNSPKRILSSPNKIQDYNDKIFLSRLRNKNVKIFQTKSKSTNRILGLNSDYMFYIPYVTKMIARGIDSTEYDSTKYTLSKKEETKDSKHQQKKYFGIPGNTLLTRRGSLSDLYSTTSLVSNTLSKMNSFSEKNIFQRTKNIDMESIIDKDRKTAEGFFLDSYRNKNLKLFSKEDKKSFYEKYNIDHKLTIDEEYKINDIIERNRKEKNNLYSTFKSLNTEDSFDGKTHTQVFERQYKDPYNSFKKMKIKKQMMKIIENLNINFQCEKFQKEYNDICELNIQKNRMKNIKVIPKKKLKIFKGFNAEQYLKKLEPTENSYLEKNKKKSKKDKKKQIIFFHKPQTIYARGIDLKEIELKVEYVPCVFHPEVRTKSAICFNEEKGELYLYGGLEGRKLADLWQFNFSQIKMGWQKIYEPKKESDFENEPCPRFGHTLHFYNKKLYVIGGEFTNWKQNLNREGIMCIFDLKNKTWDTMKYYYDINWFNKKKEEKRLTLKKRILSFQEITNSIENKNEENENSNQLNDPYIYNKNIRYRNKLKDNKTEQHLVPNKTNIAKYNLNLRNNNKYSHIKERNLFLKSIKSTKDINNDNKHIINNKLNSEELNNSNNIYPEIRRYHISLLIGNQIFLYGGETPFNKTLNDCWLYDLNTQKWSLLEYIGRYPPPLCCHSACLVLEQTQLINEALNVYYKPPSENKTLQLLKSDGVFFFGGYNESKIPTNLFFRMVLGVKPVVFEIPEIMGIGPGPRIEASMNFNSENNLIVIYGGRNDLKNEVYNDIVLLDMENMCWIKTIFWGEKPQERSEHNAIVISNKLFVFGGVNNYNFINFDFTIFNLDFFGQKYAQKIDL